MSCTSPLPYPSSLRLVPSPSPSLEGPSPYHTEWEAPQCGGLRDAGAQRDAGTWRDAEAELIQGYLGNSARVTHPCHH